MTDPDGFDRDRFADELRAAVKDSADLWFSMSKDSFVAVGRRDGAATVLVTQRGWQVLTHDDRGLRTETFDSAEEAVKAADAIAVPKVSS
jgi:hypothetical protein